MDRAEERLFEEWLNKIEYDTSLPEANAFCVIDKDEHEIIVIAGFPKDITKKDLKLLREMFCKENDNDYYDYSFRLYKCNRIM